MVIQRWQSVLLLLAVVFMSMFCVTPYAILEVANGVTSSFEPATSPVFLILNVAVAILLLIDIFLFKNLKLQMRIAKVNIILIVASIISLGVMCYTMVSSASFDTFEITYSVLYIVAALLCAIFALRFMRRDHKLLSSYDRLR